MKLLNKKYLTVITLASCLLSACSDDEENYVKGEWDAAENFQNVYFPQTSISEELDPADPTVVTIEIKRRNTQGTATVPFVIDDPDNVFFVSDATFADGEASTTFDVSFPNAEVGKEYTLKLSVEDLAFTSYLYSTDNSFTYTVTRVKWNEAGFYYAEDGSKVEGYANYTDDIVTTFFGVENVTFPTRLQERDDMPGYFRMVNTYGENYPYNEPGDWDETQDYYIYIDATDPNKVYIPSSCNTGMDWTYGDFYIHSLAGYYLANGKEDTASDYYGKYENGKITFPAGALLVGMANYNSGGLYAANGNGAFNLVVNPDEDLYEASIKDDFEWELVYNGSFESEKLGTTGTAAFYKGICVNNKDNCDKTFEENYGTAYYIDSPYEKGYNLIFSVKDGKILVPAGYEVQPTGINAVGEEVFAKINSSASSFSDKVVTLNITFQNEDGTITYATSNETLSNITYTQVGTGTYTYTQFFGSEEEPEEDPGLIISQRDDMPDVYKVSNWGYGVDFIFTWDKTTNECTVPEQFTGYVHSSYGSVYVSDLYIYTGGEYTYEDFPCYYDPSTSTFHFNVAYFVSEGVFGYGEETLTVTFDANNANAKSPAKKSLNTRNSALKRNSNRSTLFVPQRTDIKSITRNPGYSIGSLF